MATPPLPTVTSISATFYDYILVRWTNFYAIVDTPPTQEVYIVYDVTVYTDPWHATTQTVECDGFLEPGSTHTNVIEYDNLVSYGVQSFTIALEE